MSDGKKRKISYEVLKTGKLHLVINNIMQLKLYRLHQKIVNANACLM